MQAQPPSNRRMARTAGLLYLIVVLTGIFSLAYVPSQLALDTNPLQALDKLLAQEQLFRYGIAAGLLCYIAFLLLPLALYRLLHPFGRVAATVMVAFAAASVPLSFINQLHRLEILHLLKGAELLAGLPRQLLANQVTLSMQAYGKGMALSQLFWGLWLWPFGLLVWKSRILPRILGLLLMLGCLGYLAQVFGPLLVPDFQEWPYLNRLTLPASIGEIGTCLWLVIMGARESKNRKNENHISPVFPQHPEQLHQR